LRRSKVDIAIVGASLGGVMAAFQACRAARSVILVAEHDWLGGQMTAQAVPPDEHRLIESGGASASYLEFRRAMRERYLANAEFCDHTEMTEGCNPGDGWVSRLCIEPAHAADYFEALLKTYVDGGRLAIMRGAVLADVQKQAQHIGNVIVCDRSGVLHEVVADYFLDATDTGELIKLAGLQYRVGKEGRAEFGEPDAPMLADRHDQQPVTFVMALRREARPRECTEIAQPESYGFWQQYRVPHFDHMLFSESMPGHAAKDDQGNMHNNSEKLPLFAQANELDWWCYRRIVSAKNWRTPRDEVSLVNWAQNDFALHPLIDGAVAMAEVTAAAKELSRCFLYWLQTAAPRHDGSGLGYPELQLASDMLGTDDGFAQQVYVRESRRIVGLDCLSQTAITAAENAGDKEKPRPTSVENSVGIAWYNMDIHPTVVSGHGVNAKVRPFCLPLGSFIPVDCDNLIPACKNISVTHLVNASTRVHSSEWLIGEVAALLADYALCTGRPLREIYQAPNEVRAFQQKLEAAGVPTAWPSDLFI
jgi:FAD dependent oxidoreductase